MNRLDATGDRRFDCPLTTSVAAYALGALEPDERDGIAAHLPACPACRSAMDQVVGLPRLLAVVSPSEAAAGLPVPDEAMLARLFAAARERRARRRRLVAAAAASVIVAATAVGITARTGGSGPPGQTVAATQGAVHASVRLTPTSGGTELHLALSGVAPEQTCRLVVIADDGHREIAASWEASYSGTAHIGGSAALAPARIAGLLVETFDGVLLVTLPRPNAVSD